MPSNPTPPRPVLTQKELWDAYDSTRTHADGLRAIERAVLAKGDGERWSTDALNSAVETAKREAKYEVLMEVASFAWAQRDEFDINVLGYRDTHYAPPAPERVTLSDGSEVRVDGEFLLRGPDRTAARQAWLTLIRNTDTSADFQAVKSLATRLAAQGEK